MSGLVDPSRYPEIAKHLGGDPPDSISLTISAETPTLRRGLTSVNLGPGQITEDVLEWYGYGNSHILAGALHEVSGWPLAMLARENVPGEIVCVSHLGVMTRDERFMDVAGARTQERVLHEYAEYGQPNVVRETTWGEMNRILSRDALSWRDYCTGGYVQLAQELVCMLAQTIVDNVVGRRA